VPLADWPSTDRAVWLAAQGKGGPFKPGGLASTWSAATRANVERSYGVFLTWLAQEGQLDPELTPAQRLTPAILDAFIKAFAVGRAPHTVAACVRDIAYMIRAERPPHGHPWATRLGHALVNRAESSRPKLSRMAMPEELIDLGERLMAEGETALTQQRTSGAVTFRDGLMIAALAYRPLRVRNLAGLRLGTTFQIDAQGARYRFSGDDTKTSRVLEGPYPAGLTEAFWLYLKEARSLLSGRADGPDEGWLWLGRLGSPMTPNQISARIGIVTDRFLGRRVSPHLFRDGAATAIATAQSESVGITTDILGHATIDSSQRYYNQATGAIASRRFQAALAARRPVRS